MSTTTYAEVLTAHDVEIPAHLEAQAEVPVVSGQTQVQGDVIVVPIQGPRKPGTKVPPAGVGVVRGEVGGNTHLLVAEGDVSWAPVAGGPTGTVLGYIQVSEGAVAYLLHPEHGASGIGSGSYTLGRQRQQADESRLVAD